MSLKISVSDQFCPVESCVVENELCIAGVDDQDCNFINAKPFDKKSHQCCKNCNQTCKIIISRHHELNITRDT